MKRIWIALGVAVLAASLAAPLTWAQDGTSTPSGGTGTGTPAAGTGTPAAGTTRTATTSASGVPSTGSGSAGQSGFGGEEWVLIGLAAAGLAGVATGAAAGLRRVR